MQKFNNGGQADVVVALEAKCLAAQQYQHGAQAFAAALDNVMANLFDHVDIRGELLGNQRIDLIEFASDQTIQLIQRTRRWAIGLDFSGPVHERDT